MQPASRRLSTQLLRISARTSPARLTARRIVPRTTQSIVVPLARHLHVTPIRAGLIPDQEDPAPKQIDDTSSELQPAEITIEEYNERAEQYLDSLTTKLEAIQDQREDVNVEYSAGVLEATLPPHGTYVLNKQPPNKQIWLSSPLTGPKRFDWVVTGEGMNEKEGGGVGDWIYLRDGTSLSELLRKEISIDMSIDEQTAT